jgi:hypothetical protein
MTDVAVVVEGLDEVVRGLNARVGQIQSVTADAIYAGGFTLLAGAVRRAPNVTGTLRRSGRNIRIQGGTEVRFDASYALFVHEVNRNYRNGTWKYLQRAVDEDADAVVQTIIDHVRANAFNR